MFVPVEVHPAAYWRPAQDGRILCDLCPHHCRLGEGQTGRCRARGVRGGALVALTYGLVSAAHIDPIEKKPLYHFRPGSAIFSIGNWGCNLGCRCCQNWSIAQAPAPAGTPRLTPEKVIADADRSGCGAIAYTYNEPLIGFEFVRDCAGLARHAGLANVLVTNGFIEPEPAKELLPLIDALNIDVKGMDEEFYRKHCRGSLAPVLAFAAQARAAGCHVEITNLVIPSRNDDDSSFDRLGAWLAQTLGATIPLHLSAYHPDYELELPPTPPATLSRAFSICRRHLAYVYVGNIQGTEGHDTICPGCGSILIGRRGFSVKVSGVRSGACISCGRRADIAGIKGEP